MNFHFSGSDPDEIFKIFFGGKGGDTFFKTSFGLGSNFRNFHFFNMEGDEHSGFSSAFDDEDDFESFFSHAGGDPFYSSFFKKVRQQGKNKKK